MLLGSTSITSPTTLDPLLKGADIYNSLRKKIYAYTEWSQTVIIESNELTYRNILLKLTFYRMVT